MSYLPLHFPIDFIFSQFETMMLEQLSFENEIKHHNRFKKNIAYNTNIVVPDIIDEYCNSTQIVMTKIDGTHYSSSFSSELCDTYVKYITEMISKNFILDGFIHSDLHAGNMLFTPDHKIGIIDFGLMIQLTVKERQSFFDLLRYLSAQDFNNAVDIVVSELLEPEHVKKMLTTKQTCELKASLIEIYVQSYSIQKAFTVKDILCIIQIVHKYNLTISNVFYKLMFFIVSSECFINKLSPQYLHIFMDTINTMFSDEDEE